MQILTVVAFLVLGLTGIQAFDICAAGQIFLAIQSVTAPNCAGCSSYLQCVGNRNAVTRCGLISQADANATAVIISNGAGFAQYISTYLGATVDTAASTNGQNGVNCLTTYGSSSTCTVAQGPPGPPGPRGPRSLDAADDRFPPGPPPPGPRPGPRPGPFSNVCALPPTLL